MRKERRHAYPGAPYKVDDHEELKLPFKWHERASEEHSILEVIFAGDDTDPEAIYRIKNFIDWFPSNWRDVLILRLKGYQLKEITSILGMTESQVWYISRNVRMKLKELLD